MQHTLDEFAGTFAISDHHRIPEVLVEYLSEVFDKKLENKWIASRHQLSNIDLDTINEELNAVWEGPGSIAKIKAYTLESRAARLGQMIETQPKNKKATSVPTLDSNLKITD